MALNNLQAERLAALTEAGFKVRPEVFALLDTLTDDEMNCLLNFKPTPCNTDAGREVRAAIFDGVGAHIW